MTGVSGLKPLPLGNSDNVRVGDPVVAIGAPFDLARAPSPPASSAPRSGPSRPAARAATAATCRTSTRCRPTRRSTPATPAARSSTPRAGSSASTAPSGPPTAAPSSDGGQAGSIGLGFAIPINQGKRVAEELINTGKATHPVIGVTLDMDYTGDGARVGDEERRRRPPRSPRAAPATRAGIKPGDVITEVDGQRVHSGEELIVKIRAHRPGDRLELTLLRDGRSGRSR